MTRGVTGLLAVGGGIGVLAVQLLAVAGLLASAPTGAATVSEHSMGFAFDSPRGYVVCRERAGDNRDMPGEFFLRDGVPGRTMPSLLLEAVGPAAPLSRQLRGPLGADHDTALAQVRYSGLNLCGGTGPRALIVGDSIVAMRIVGVGRGRRLFEGVVRYVNVLVPSDTLEMKHVEGYAPFIGVELTRSGGTLPVLIHPECRYIDDASMPEWFRVPAEQLARTVRWR